MAKTIPSYIGIFFITEKNVRAIYDVKHYETKDGLDKARNYYAKYKTDVVYYEYDGTTFTPYP